jgi:hypothetical protein
MDSASSSVPTPLAAGFARTFRGVTGKRLALFCAIVAVPAMGQVIANAIIPGKDLPASVVTFVKNYIHLILFFAPVWCAVIVAGNWGPTRTGPRVLALIGAVTVGLVIGTVLGKEYMAMAWSSAMDDRTLLKAISGMVLWSRVVGAAVVGYYFFSREEEASATLLAEEMRREAQDRELAEARVQVMQAQVEPHFLFNTLANVRRLFQTDPAAARIMLDHLTRYLSAMLPRMRSAHSTLGQELALALAYLHVQQVRMGSRLTVATDVSESLEALAFPPMMLVTLVENAIRHGINPLPQGGEVRIAARLFDGRLRLQVADTGRGLSESSGAGVGLANIRARLSTLYGGGARLLLSQNSDRGVIATIELPTASALNATRAA